MVSDSNSAVGLGKTKAGADLWPWGFNGIGNALLTNFTTSDLKIIDWAVLSGS